MKKTIIGALLVLLAGCSFSKHEPQGPDLVKQSRVDEVMSDERYSNLHKVELAVKNGMWDIFQAALPKLSKTELNSLTVSGETLGALALKFNRVDFLEALLKAGLSPFRRSYNQNYKSQMDYKIDLRGQSLKSGNSSAQIVVDRYRNLYLQETAKRCALSLSSLIEYMDENYISPLDPVCGGGNLFYGIFSDRNHDDAKIEKILLHYFDSSRDDFDFIFNRILNLSVEYGNAEIFRRLDVICGDKGIACPFYTDQILSISYGKIDRVAYSLSLMKENMPMNQAMVIDFEKQIFKQILGFSEKELDISLVALNKYGLKADFESMRPELENVLKKKYDLDGGVLPPPPGFSSFTNEDSN